VIVLGIAPKSPGEAVLLQARGSAVSTDETSVNASQSVRQPANQQIKLWTQYSSRSSMQKQGCGKNLALIKADIDSWRKKYGLLTYRTSEGRARHATLKPYAGYH
jgi:hypothetical protein